MPTIISGDTGIDKIAAGAIEYADLPTGNVLQVVNATYTTFTSITSTSYSATGLTATITPKSATSKILVLVSMNGLYIANSSNAFRFDLYKNGSSIAYLEDILGYQIVGNLSSSYQYLDSPATTSATTYAIYWAGQTTGQLQFNNYYSAPNRTRSGITLLEIAQ